MITFSNFGFAYAHTKTQVLRDVDCSIASGQFALVTGRSGSGKSTLLRALNGLVPHFSGGHVSGQVRVAGMDPIQAGPEQMSRMVGFVFQDPDAQFVTDTVEDELAFGLENAGLPQRTMRLRVEETLDLLDLAALRERRIDTLSGGERQRVAIAAALVLRPRVLVLDEPTSQLDPKSADDVLHSLLRLNHDLGLTVVLSEHRLERVLPYADVLLHTRQQRVLSGPPHAVLPALPDVPPLVAVARARGWQPLPLTIKAGRVFAAMQPVSAATETVTPIAKESMRTRIAGLFQTPKDVHGTHIALRDLSARHANRRVLNITQLDVNAGEMVAVLGRNGSGKTTLLRCLTGLHVPSSAGVLNVNGAPIAGRAVAEICRHVAYLPQAAGDLLFAETVREELARTLQNHGLPDAGAVDGMLLQLGLHTLADHHPRDLSLGEQQRVAFGAVAITQPPLLLLDEPTRGLDQHAKRELATLLRARRDAGAAVMVVTHDIEFAAELAQRVLVLAQGEIIADGPAVELLDDSPLFAPQVARLFPGRGWLTVKDVQQKNREG